MVTRASALGGHADVGNAGVFGAEVVGKDVDIAYRFQCRLTGGRFTKNSTIGTLSIKGEVRAVALGAQELERTVSTRLCNIRIQIQERVHAATVARKIDDRAAGNGVA